MARAGRVSDWALSQGHTFSSAEAGLWRDGCKGKSGGGDNPVFVEAVHDFFAAIPPKSRGYVLFFNRHECVNIDQFPNAKAEFERLFGG